MRGDNEQEAAMFSYISPEQRVPADHPLRPIRQMTDEIFKQLSPRFDKLYSRVGRPSIAITWNAWPCRWIGGAIIEPLTNSISTRCPLVSMSGVIRGQYSPFIDHA